MKRLLIILSLIVLSLSSCQKSSLPKGLYFADTKDGLLYLEIQSNDKGLLFFQGGEKEECTCRISKGEVDLSGHASITIDRFTHSWWFGGALGKGTINGDSFTIKSQWSYLNQYGYLYLTFYKH